MKKIAIIICARYRNCGGGKCFRAMKNREGAFARYPADEEISIVGYSSCGGCPGGNIEYVPEEFKKNGVDVIHLATGLVVGYPPCQNIRKFKEYLEKVHGVPVVVGTHPIPTKYAEAHAKLPFWKQTHMSEIAPELFNDSPQIQAAYN
jgi:predicted metal-binding protein